MNLSGRKTCFYRQGELAFNCEKCERKTPAWEKGKAVWNRKLLPKRKRWVRNLENNNEKVKSPSLGVLLGKTNPASPIYLEGGGKRVSRSSLNKKEARLRTKTACGGKPQNTKYNPCIGKGRPSSGLRGGRRCGSGDEASRARKKRIGRAKRETTLDAQKLIVWWRVGHIEKGPLPRAGRGEVGWGQKVGGG